MIKMTVKFITFQRVIIKFFYYGIVDCLQDKVSAAVLRVTVAAVGLTVTRSCPHLRIGSDEEKARSREKRQGSGVLGQRERRSLTGNSSGYGTEPNLPQPKPVENETVGGERARRDYFVLTRYPCQVYLHWRSVKRSLSIRYRYTYLPRIR